jgi:GNAT superfamily N-acetyltransferase
VSISPAQHCGSDDRQEWLGDTHNDTNGLGILPNFDGRLERIVQRQRQRWTARPSFASKGSSPGAGRILAGQRPIGHDRDGTPAEAVARYGQYWTICLCPTLSTAQAGHGLCAGQLGSRYRTTSLAAVTDHSDGLSVHLLADYQHLVEAVAEMRWREWGQEPGREDLSWWVDVTASEAGQRGLPVTWVAVDEGGNAAGAVGLGKYDIAERCDRSPWVLGMIVRAASRGLGVGRLLLTSLERYAARQGYAQIWVATGGPAVGFYRRCGWVETERLPPAWADQLTILTRMF